MDTNPPPDTNREAALKALYGDLAQHNLFPFWATAKDVENDEIRQLMAVKRALPHLWSYKRDIEEILHRSAQLVTMADSERRSVICVNPGLAPTRASVSTMYTAYRLNDPNEIMPPHKHTASAIRFGLVGNSNFTGVEGEDVVFGPGDMVLTPIDTWHNHGTVGDEAAVNLSVLDLPLVDMLNAAFFEHHYVEDGERKKKQTARYTPDYSQRIYGAGGLRPRFVNHHRGAGFSSPMYVYRWEPTQALLDKHAEWDGDPHEAIMVEYVDPTTGGPVFKTITFFAQLLRPGEATLPLRQTASLLVSPFKGKGYSIVDGKRFDWAEFDTLAVPGGAWCEHHNGSATEPAYLFVASDEPAQKAFALYRKWGKDMNGEVSRLA